MLCGHYLRKKWLRGLGFPTTPVVTARIWKAWSRMHHLVMCLEHSMDNEGANTELRSWCAHLSSPAAASGRTSSQGVSQVGATEPADLQQCFPKTLVFPRLCFLKAFSHTVSPDLVRSCPGWVAAFSDEIHFQCNRPVFWSRCPC